VTDRGRGWHLFMCDSRTHREHRAEHTLDSALLLGETQTTALEDWLLEAPGGNLKVITSAAMLAPRNRRYLEDPLYLDHWQGYPASLHRMLAFLCDEQRRNVVFLSGDLHMACSAQVSVTHQATGRTVRFDSFHAPALYSPFPFANESRWNLLWKDAFAFRHAGADYQCTIEAQPVDYGANGIGLLEAGRADGGWSVGMQVLKRPA
jgi:phosphodiesterase/alkaline phosphatase D-like protein